MHDTDGNDDDSDDNDYISNDDDGGDCRLDILNVCVE